tara:strand:- start:118 stop:591 length:474 start_codon:yes stop_codon:yes gene_type:complete
MVKKLIFILGFIIAFSSNVYALEAKKWNFIKEDEYCYIGSIPYETDLDKEKKRGDTYIIVYKIIGNKETIVQIEAGYNYKLNKDIIVKIDESIFKFYTVEDIPETAWTDFDDKVIYAMKKGMDLVITGNSSRGTVTNDKYTLKGFTAAFNQLSTECK